MKKEKIDKILNGEILIDNIEDLIYMYNNYFDPDLLYHCNDVIRDNIEVAKLLCNTDLCFYLDISERLKESRELLLYILENMEFYHGYSNSSREFCCILEVAKEKFRKDKEIVRLAIEKDKFNYEMVDDDQREIYYVDETLLDDKNFAIELVQIQPYVLKHLSENLKKDKDVVLASVKHNGLTLKDANDKLKRDKEVVLEAVKENSSALRYVDKELFNEKDFVLQSVKIDADLLANASEELQNDKEVVLEAVKKDWHALEYGSEELQNDKEIVLEAIKQSGYALRYASEELRNDIDFIISLATKNIEVLVSSDILYKIHNIYGNKYDKYIYDNTYDEFTTI